MEIPTYDSSHYPKKMRFASGAGLLIRAAALISALPLISTPAVAQWLTMGDDMYSTNTGNVGIGTTTPKRISAAGDVGFGTTSLSHKLHVVGDAHVSGTLSGGVVRATYQDLAEWVPSSQDLPPGTVVVLDPEQRNHVIASAEAYDTSVAGVISEQPGLLLGEGGEGKLMVATTGRVKVRIDATARPVKIGDILVTSDRPGTAMVSEAVEFNGRKMHTPGTILGKALEPLDGGIGEILVLLSLQ